MTAATASSSSTNPAPNPSNRTPPSAPTRFQTGGTGPWFHLHATAQPLSIGSVATQRAALFTGGRPFRLARPGTPGTNRLAALEPTNGDWGVPLRRNRIAGSDLGGKSRSTHRVTEAHPRLWFMPRRLRRRAAPHPPFLGWEMGSRGEGHRPPGSSVPESRNGEGHAWRDAARGCNSGLTPITELNRTRAGSGRAGGNRRRFPG